MRLGYENSFAPLVATPESAGTYPPSSTSSSRVSRVCHGRQVLPSSSLTDTTSGAREAQSPETGLWARYTRSPHVQALTPELLLGTLLGVPRDQVSPSSVLVEATRWPLVLRASRRTLRSRPCHRVGWMMPAPGKVSRSRAMSAVRRQVRPSSSLRSTKASQRGL